MKTEKRKNNLKGIRLMMGFGWSHKNEQKKKIYKPVLGT